MEEQAFSPSYDSVPRPPPPPSPVSNFDRRLRKRGNLLTLEGAGGVRGPKSYDGEKACSSMNNSKLSVCYKKTEIIYYLQAGAALMVRLIDGMCALWFGLVGGHAQCAPCGLVWPEGLV
jgi:hypothetical protein